MAESYPNLNKPRKHFNINWGSNKHQNDLSKKYENTDWIKHMQYEEKGKNGPFTAYSALNPKTPKKNRNQNNHFNERQ